MPKKLLAAHDDFQSSDLPSMRRAQFFDILKMRWELILKMGLLFLLFFLPLLAAIIYRDFNFAGLEKGLSAELETGEITKEQFDQEFVTGYQGIKFIFALLLIPCLLVLSFYFMGAMRIYRQLAYGEPIYFWHDFMKGIKNNWLSFGMIFLLGGIITAFLVIFFNTGDQRWYLYVIPLALSVDLLFPIGLIMLSLLTCYQVSLGDLIKNSFVIYLKKIHIILPTALLFLSPILLGMLNVAIFKWLILVLVAILLVPLMFLFWNQFTLSCFDQYINAQKYPELLFKGLYVRDQRRKAYEEK